MAVAFTDGSNFCGACGATIGMAMYGTAENTCCNFYRAVIVSQAKNNPSQEKFQLSGIGVERPAMRLDPELESFLYVPLKQNRAVEEAFLAGYPGHKTSKAVEIHRATYWSSENCNVYPHGYPIHARCWVLIERCLGGDGGGGIAQQHQLERLIIALRKRWYTGSYGFEELLPMEDTCRPWIPACLFSTPEADDATWVFQTNPVEIPNVKVLVEQSIRAASRKDRCRKWRIWRPLQQRGKGQCLPIELCYLILDLLDHSDVKNCLKALEWSIPECYWRQRIGGLIFEHKDVPATVSIDWEFLCLGAERLLDTSMGLQNRKRIWRILREVKSIFCSIEDKGSDMISLRDFINETYPPYSGPIEWDWDAALKTLDERNDRLPLYSKISPHRT